MKGLVKELDFFCKKVGTIQNYGANAMRIAVYTETSSGYIDNGKEGLGILYQVIDFFDRVSRQYANHADEI